MHRSLVFFALAFVVTPYVGVPAYGADWPQWQGSDRDSISGETGLLKQWPEDGPALGWRINGLGGGDSAPAVADGTLYGMSSRDGKEIVWALSESDGKEKWTSTLGDAVAQRVRQSKEGPACTPTVDGGRLYVIGMGGTVACLDCTDGRIVWRKSFTEDFGGSVPTWSYRESPLVDGNNVICTPGSANARLIALDKMTGETVWKCSYGSASDSNEVVAREPETDTNAAPSKEPTVVLKAGATWRYFDKGRLRDSAWATADFSDKDWSEGKAEFGYGDDDEKTRLDSSAGNYPTYYFRKQLTVADPAALPPLVLRLLRDDGAIVYLNGEEICRDNLEEGGVDHSTFAAGATDVEDDFYVHEFPKEKLRRGKNMLAVEVHQSSATSSDVSFDLEVRERIASDRPGVAPRRRSRGGRGGMRSRSGAAYSSAIAVDLAGVRQYIQMTPKALVGVRASDGEDLWQYDAPANGMGINCSTPIYKDGLVFAASAYGAGGGAIKLVKGPDGEIEVEEVYFTSQMQNHHGGMIVVDGALYGANGGNGGGFLACLDFQTGKVLWRDRKGPKGALAYADGRLYLRDEKGPLLLIEPSKDGFVERGRFDQPDRSSSPAWARPVISNGKLYVRDQDLLLCYDIQSK